jgi:hypothetical protein
MLHPQDRDFQKALITRSIKQLHKDIIIRLLMESKKDANLITPQKSELTSLLDSGRIIADFSTGNLQTGE